jgi:hypothetical protein
MTDIVYTHFFSTNGTSSVIEEVFYSEPDELLFVQLVSGVVAGYEDVPLNVFTALKVLNNNRLQGDTDSSVGRYWNSWIKPIFRGFNTSDVSLFSVEEYEKLNAISSPVADNTKSAPVEANYLYYPPFEELDQYGVILVDTGSDSDDQITLSVKATSLDDAVKRFNEAKAILGWNDDIKVRAVVKFLD